MRMQKSRLESELNEVLSRHESEAEEWQQFQKDLQVAVVIANDFRAETQESMQRMSEENMSLREKVLNQQLELDRLRTELQAFRSTKAFEDSRLPSSRSSTILSNAELKGKVGGGGGGSSWGLFFRGSGLGICSSFFYFLVIVMFLLFSLGFFGCVCVCVLLLLFWGECLGTLVETFFPSGLK